MSFDFDLRFRNIVAILVLAMTAVTIEAQSSVPQLLPYTVTVLAGGGSAQSYPGACTQSGNTVLDAYGDGCLATEILLSSSSTTGTGPRYAIADSTGAVFFSDASNGLIRRIDPETGVVNAVAGGATASPAPGVTCGAAISADALGDGCNSKAVKLDYPAGLVFGPDGSLYFADYGNHDVRKIAATNGVIPATGGVITNVAGNIPASGYPKAGYWVSNTSTTVLAATQSYLSGPTGVAFDSQGDLLITETTKDAVLAVNTNASTTTTVNGVFLAPGTIWKIVGAYGTTSPTKGGTPSACINGTSGTYGCSYNPYVENAAAVLNWLDSPYGVALDSNGNLYVANEYNNVIPIVNSAGTMSTFTGNQNASAGGTDLTVRAKVGANVEIGSPFGIAVDGNNNIYFTDALNGAIWRVDANDDYQYAIAGGATSANLCSAATDSYGDGCPALQAAFGKSGTSYATTSKPGILGVSVDAYSNLYVGDVISNSIRKISSGTQFGSIGNTQPTQAVEIHFAPGDGPASSGAYVISAGAGNFNVSQQSCTTNSQDDTMDCLLRLQATPSKAGSFSGTLTVNSAAGQTASFPLSGTLQDSPVTRTSVTYTANTTISGTTYSTGTQITLTATISSTGTPTGTVQFYDNGAAVGTPAGVSGSGTATLMQTFAAGSHSISATYSGDSYFAASSSITPVTFTTANPGYAIALGSSTNQSTVTAGQTALYTLAANTTLYSGTLSFSCSGLPSGTSCQFSPSTITSAGDSKSYTVALSIYTSAQPTVVGAGFAGGCGFERMLSVLVGMGLALGIGLRRRKVGRLSGTAGVFLALLLTGIGLTACSGKVSDHSVGTPTGTYSVTVSIVGSVAGTTPTGAATSIIAPLVVQ